MKSHKDLDAWKKSMRLAKKVYEVTTQFPREEMFGIVAQMRRAAVSVPSNIAEGAARSSKKEFAHFLHIALGSLAELETQALLSLDLGFLKKSSLQIAVEDTKSVVYGLARYVKG